MNATSLRVSYRSLVKKKFLTNKKIVRIDDVQNRIDTHILTTLASMVLGFYLIANNANKTESQPSDGVREYKDDEYESTRSATSRIKGIIRIGLDNGKG